MENTLKEQLAALNRFYQKQDQIYHDCARRSGLSDTAFWLLYALCESEETYTQNIFCDEWHYTKQTVNSALTGLVKKGYIKLKMINGTRNSKEITLTGTGKAFCRDFIIPVLEADRHAFGRLSEEERNTFLKLAEKQLSCLQEELAASGKE